mgnify:CR=1 FL=1
MSTSNPEDKILALRRNLAVQREECLRLAPEEALERILDSPQPAALVHAFPEEDLHILIREIGPEDALPLIALASNKQREYLLDQEIWQRDRIDLTATVRWLDRLLRADPSPTRSIQWLAKDKLDVIELFLSRAIEVQMRENDQDPSVFGADFFSYDNVFYIRIISPPTAPKEEEPSPGGVSLHDTVKKLLDHLADSDYVRLQGILLEAAHVLPAESEEEAYRLRTVRLAEKGFLPFEEAVGLYQPLNDQVFPHKARRQHRLAPSQPDFFPLVPTTVLPEGNLFTRALASLDDREQRQALQEEFATLCNRIIVADRQKIDRREALATVVAKASGYIHIGLQKRLPQNASGASGTTAAREIGRYHLEGLFRLGFGEAARLKRAAEEWVHQSWFAGQGLSLTFWGETWLGVIGGLLLKRPLFFDNYRAGRMYREFACQEDIDWSRRQLLQVQRFDGLLGRIDPTLNASAKAAFLTYKNLLLSLWARSDLGLSKEIRPIATEAFQPFFEALFQPGATPTDKGHKISDAKRSQFLEWLATRTDEAATALSASIGSSLESLFVELEENYGRVSADRIDPRYVSHFLLAH